jgi:hypothetical protein
MLFTTFKYKIFRLTGFSLFNRKSSYNENILAGETLFSLKQKMKQTPEYQTVSQIDLSTNHLSIGSTIHEVYGRYGKPAHQQTIKVDGTTHDVVLYKRIMNGMKAKIIYNFVDEILASVSFHIRTETPEEKARVQLFVKSTYLINDVLPSSHCLCVSDASGNKLIYENTFDSSLTFINNKPEVLSAINAALYQDQFSSTKQQTSTSFELSF